MQPQPRQRDLRIDFFKGVALLVVLIDHIEGWARRSVIEAWTLINLGFSDAAEIFIFTSGYVFAVAYSRTIAERGFVGLMLKTLKRTAQIYAAYLLASVTMIALGAACLEWLPPDYKERFLIGEFVPESLVAAVLLCFHPWGYDILAMYVLVLPLMAVLLYLLRSDRASAAIACLISFTLYLVAQVRPDWNLPRFGDGGLWYFNPLAWQLLFFLGLVVGNPRATPRPQIIPRWLLVVASGAMLVWGFAVLKAFGLLIAGDVVTRPTLQPMIDFYYRWGGKTTLGPLRLLHFFALAYLTALLLPRTLRFWGSRVARPLVVAGQHSLEVYAFGLVATFVGVFVLQRGIGLSTGAVLLVDLLACVASIGFAYLVAGWKGRGRPAAATVASTAAPPHDAPAASTPRSAAGRRKPARPRRD